MTCVWLAFYARRGHLRRNIPFCLVSESPAPATPTQARPLRPLCLPRPAAPHHKLEPSPGVRRRLPWKRYTCNGCSIAQMLSAPCVLTPFISGKFRRHNLISVFRWENSLRVTAGGLAGPAADSGLWAPNAKLSPPPLGLPAVKEVPVCDQTTRPRPRSQARRKKTHPRPRRPGRTRREATAASSAGPGRGRGGADRGPGTDGDR